MGSVMILFPIRLGIRIGSLQVSLPDRTDVLPKEKWGGRKNGSEAMGTQPMAVDRAEQDAAKGALDA